MTREERDKLFKILLQQIANTAIQKELNLIWQLHQELKPSSYSFQIRIGVGGTGIITEVIDE